MFAGIINGIEVEDVVIYGEGLVDGQASFETGGMMWEQCGEPSGRVWYFWRGVRASRFRDFI